MGAEVFHNLKKVLHKRNLSTAVGDEGGFAPALNGTEDAIESILEAIKMAGYKPGRKCEGGDVSIGMDCASSEFYADGVYDYTKFEGEKGAKRSSKEQVEYLKSLVAKYPIDSIEDGMSENDWEGWQLLTAEIAAMRERGYTLEQIAALLTEDDLQIGAPTLKSYLQRAASTGKHGSKQRSTKRKAASTATSPSSTPAAQAATSTAQGQPPALTIGERAAASISETPGSKTSATAAITRPDRERI